MSDSTSFRQILVMFMPLGCHWRQENFNTDWLLQHSIIWGCLKSSIFYFWQKGDEGDEGIGSDGGDECHIPWFAVRISGDLLHPWWNCIWSRLYIDFLCNLAAFIMFIAFGVNTALGSKNSDTQYVGGYIYLKLAECGHQIFVTKIFNGGRTASILKKLLENISALNSNTLHLSC